MYKFVKKRCNRTGLVDNWLLECNTADVLEEHHTKIFSSIIEDGIKDVFTYEQEVRHLKTHYGSAIDALSKIKEDSYFNTFIELEHKIVTSKLNALLKYGHILLRENGSYTIYSDDDEIIETMISNELAYPNYTLDDIRLKQWQGGNHWYAYIGNLHVTMNGKNKWNTQKYARQMAEEYYHTIVKK